MPTTTQTPSLIDQAQALYASQGCKHSNRIIASKMNASSEWVRKFINGEFTNPGVITVEAFIKAVKELG